MERRIAISSGTVSMGAALNESATATKIWEALPIESAARRWGDEVYFEIPVQAGAEDAQESVPSGTIAYWPPGECFCIFFGQRPASPVNVVGKLDGEPGAWAGVKEGDAVRLERG